jgi:hypothetical protein
VPVLHHHHVPSAVESNIEAAVVQR